jgi:hypothetical protein
MDTELELAMARAFDPISARIGELAEAFRQHVEVDAAETRLVRDLAERTSELAEDVAAVANTLRGYWHASERVLHTKAAADTLRCVECGAEFGAEPGPQLCGPCWVTNGRPRLWPVSTNGGSDAC